MDRIPAPDRPVRYGNPAAQLARSTCKTALSNSFIFAFDSRLKRGVQAWASQLPGRQPTSKRKISTIANCISGRKPVSIDRTRELHPREVAFIREERALLGFERTFTGLDSTRAFGESCATDKWCKQNWRTVLSGYHRWLREVERSPSCVKKWSLVPLCRLQPMAIHIDTKVVFHFMRGAGLVQCKWEDFQEFAPDHFASVFKLDKIVRSNRYTFANHVATD
jgi:hypothetical protein